MAPSQVVLPLGQETQRGMTQVLIRDKPGSSGMTPGMRLARSQRLTGTRRPQRGSVGRVRLYNVTDDAVVDGPQSGGAGWAEGRAPAAARPPRRRGAADPAWRVALDDEAFVVDARVGVRSVVQHGVDHADTGRHLAPGATHLPGAAPVTAEIA